MPSVKHRLARSTCNFRPETVQSCQLPCSMCELVVVSLAWHCAASASHISLVPGTGLAHGSTQAPWISGHAREGGHSAIKTGQVRAGLHD